MALIDSEGIDSRRARLRDVNNRVAQIDWRGQDEVLTLLCECADGFCVEQVQIGRRRYGEIRAEDGLVLAPRHVTRSI
jgi:hypothetical protein